MRLIGTISILSIQKQINQATLNLLDNYSKVLENNSEKDIRDFIKEETKFSSHSNRVDLVGDGFLVSACVRGLSLDPQRWSENLCDALDYGLTDSIGTSVHCSVSEDNNSIDFWYED